MNERFLISVVIVKQMEIKPGLWANVETINPLDASPITILKTRENALEFARNFKGAASEEDIKE